MEERKQRGGGGIEGSMKRATGEVEVKDYLSWKRFVWLEAVMRGGGRATTKARGRDGAIQKKDRGKNRRSGRKDRKCWKR